MLEKKLLLFYMCLLIAMPGHAWEFEQNINIEGVLKRAERTGIIRNSDGKEETKIERSIVLVTDKPLVLAHSVMIEKQPIVSAEISYPHIGVYLPEEFHPLIEKHVKCSGTFQRTFNHDDEIKFHIDVALDSQQLLHQLKTFFYEPEEVELCGMLYEEVYPGPPEYTNVKMGDRLEKAVFLTLKEPINVEIKNAEIEEEGVINEPEKGVRELQVVFADSSPSELQMKKEISLKGTLYHAHTAHHHRRVLMTVESWKTK